MRLKQFIFGLMALLTMATGIQQPLLAAKKHKSHTSSSSDKKDKHSKKSKQHRKTKLLKEIKDATKENNEIAKHDLEIDKKTHCAVEKLLDSASTCKVIRPEDFADCHGHLTQTYVIKESGRYCLGADVAFKPLEEFTPAIKILANDVTLDLGEFTLSQASCNHTANAYGVQIGHGYNSCDPDAVLKNITVENGSVVNFTGIGVFCYNASFDEPSAQVPFQDLHFFKLNILDCGSYDSTDFGSGLNLGSNAVDSLYDLDLPVAFKNILVEDCNVNRCLGTGAINIYTADDVVIRNTHANDTSNNGSPLGFVAAFDIACRNLQMYECQANGTSDFDETNSFGAAIGGYIVNSINVYIKDCQFDDTFGESDVFVGGADFSNNQNAIYEDCQFNNTRGGPGIIFAAGVDISDAPGQETKSSGVKFINCQFNGTSVDDRNPGGVFDWGIFGVVALTLQDIVFEDCQASNIVTDIPGFVSFGYWVGTEPRDPEFPFGNLYNVTFTNCIASDITGGADTAGFAVPADTLNLTGHQGSQKNIVFENCIAERISNKSHVFPVSGIGEYSQIAPGGKGPIARMTNLLIKGCRVSDVRGECSNPLSAGILVKSVINPIIIGNIVSDCDRGILLTGSHHITPNGFQLACSKHHAHAWPPVFIDLNTIPSAAPLQTFINNCRDNRVSIAPTAATIDTVHDFILPPVDLTELGWKTGDEISYVCNGGSPIADLECNKTYYAIVYVPGFSENGLIQENKVENCTVSCYQDDAHVTSSAWIDNTAFNCGHPPSVPPCSKTNYTINFNGRRPIDVGTLDDYPKHGHKYYNLSLVSFGRPRPPKDFVGTFKEGSHSSSSDGHHIIHVTWEPSESKDVVAYHIYKGDEIIKTVASDAPLRFIISTHSKNHLSEKYKITAVTATKIESKAEHLTLIILESSSSSSSHRSR